MGSRDCAQARERGSVGGVQLGSRDCLQVRERGMGVGNS